MTLELAESIEADSIWMTDHLLGPFHPALWPEVGLSALGGDPDAFFDASCVAAVAGRMTARPVGVAVTDSVRRRAADVARTALTLQHLCPGGFNLGVGAGEAMSTVPFGYDFATPASTCETFLRDLRSLLDSGHLPGGGAARMGIPLQTAAGRPKVWVAGHGPRMLRLTAQYGDGWLPAWAMAPDEYGARLNTIAHAAADAGRPRPEAGLYAFLVLGESKERIAEQFESEPLAKLLALMAPGELWARHGAVHPCGIGSRGFVDVVVHELDPDELRDLAPTVPFGILDEMLMLGNDVEVADQLGRFAEHGLEHVVFGLMTGLVGGADEMFSRLPMIGSLRQRLRAL